jgi:hypothetical protein
MATYTHKEICRHEFQQEKLHEKPVGRQEQHSFAVVLSFSYPKPKPSLLNCPACPGYFFFAFFMALPGQCPGGKCEPGQREATPLLGLPRLPRLPR